MDIQYGYLIFTHIFRKSLKISHPGHMEVEGLQHNSTGHTTLYL